MRGKRGQGEIELPDEIPEQDEEVKERRRKVVRGDGKKDEGKLVIHKATFDPTEKQLPGYAFIAARQADSIIFLETVADALEDEEDFNFLESFLHHTYVTSRSINGRIVLRGADISEVEKTTQPEMPDQFGGSQMRYPQ